MIFIGVSCLLENTDLAAKLREIIPIINLQVGATVKNGKPTFRQVRAALIKETGVEIDLDTFAQMYKEEIPSVLRFTSDSQIDEILNRPTKRVLDDLARGAIDRIDGIGETSTERAAIHKAASLLKTIEGKNAGKRTKTISRIIKDAVLTQIERLAKADPNYSLHKTRDPKKPYEEVLSDVMEINSVLIQQTDADKFSTIQEIFDKSRDKVMEALEGMEDEEGNPMLAEEGERFLEDYKNAVIGTLMSSGQATTIVRGALLDAGYGKKQGEANIVDWKKISGGINSPHVLHDNVVNALVEKRGFTPEAATSLANSLANEFNDLVRSQAAMDVKYNLAETRAADIMDKLGWKPDQAKIDSVNANIRAAIDESVAIEDELDISKIVDDALLANGAKESQLRNVPKRAIKLRSHTADKIARLIKDDGDLDADAEAELFATLGKAIDPDAINDLRRLAKLRNEVENIDIRIHNTGLLTTSKQGIEKAKVLQAISQDMARLVANSADYSDRSWISKKLGFALNGISKYISANAALVLLNPFNLTQNILSGAFVRPHASVGGKIVDLFGGTRVPIMYKNSDGKKIDLSKLLNMTGRFETWWETLQGAEGRDIPDLFTGDPSKDTKTLKNAETAPEKLEAYATLLPRAALTATDSMLKEPYFRQEVIRGVLYYLQNGPAGMTKKQAQDLVYEALTGNKRLIEQATQLATMVDRGGDKYYVKQIAEDIQLSSLLLMREDGRSLLSEQNLQSIIDAATQTTGEVFGHRIQKNVVALQWLYDWVSGGRAKAAESINREFGEKLGDLYKKGEYSKAAWLHFWHNLKNTMGFLFTRGIYNWAVLTAQKNPVSIITGFRQLARHQPNFFEEKGTRDAVENYLRSRAKIGRGIMGTTTALAVAPLVMSALGDTPEERKKRLAALRKDPVWGRVFNNFVSPFAQGAIDASLSKTPTAGALQYLKDMAIKPVVSAGAKYYSTDNQVGLMIEEAEKGRLQKVETIAGGLLGMFLPFKSFIATNKAWVDRRFMKDSPAMVDENYQIVFDQRAKPKHDDFWDAFWYSGLFKEKK